MMGSFGRSLESPATIASFAISTAIYNLPKDYYSTYLTRLAAITPAEVQLTAQKYIRPDNSYLIVVGKAEDLAPKLKKFAKSGEIIYYDVEGNIYDPNKKLKPAPTGVTTMQNMPITMDMYFKAPDKMLMQVGSGAMVFAKQIYNGGKGVSSSPMSGETKAIEGDELEGMKEASMIFPELYYATLGYTTQLLGIEVQKNQKQLYKVQVNKGDRKETEYYDVQSGLKVRAENKEQVTEYGDYKAIDGIMFPHLMTQNMGPQTISFVVSAVKLNTKLKDDFFEVK